MASTVPRLRARIGAGGSGDVQMRRSMAAKPGAAGLAGLLGLVLSGVAHAQSHTCRYGDTVVVSSQPCTGSVRPRQDPAPAGLAAYGNPQQRMQVVRMPAPGTPRAEDHVGFLGVECAELSEGIRTGPARGIRGDTLAELMQTYRRKCAEEDNTARQRVSERHSREAQQRRAEKSAEQETRSRAIAEEERCFELLRILHAKRQREASMSEGQRSDLQRSAAAYQERCKRG